MDAKSSEPLTLVVEREFDAAAEMVFDAWLDSKSLGKWLFATPDGIMQRVECDPRVGGEFAVIEQRGDLLAEHYGRFVELERPRRIVFDFWTSFETTPTRVTVDIVSTESGCELTLSHEVPPKWAEFKERTRAGWTMILDGLSSMLYEDFEVVSSRIFDAPRERVFQAFSDPQQLAKWWGPNGFTNTIEEFDFREGGSWKLTMHGSDGVAYRNESVFLTVAPPERIVYDHLGPMHRFLMTMTYFEFDGKTRLTWRMRFTSPAECTKVKALVAVANEQNFDRLTAHLKEATL